MRRSLLRQATQLVSTVTQQQQHRAAAAAAPAAVGAAGICSNAATSGNGAVRAHWARRCEMGSSAYSSHSLRAAGAPSAIDSTTSSSFGFALNTTAAAPTTLQRRGFASTARASDSENCESTGSSGSSSSSASSTSSGSTSGTSPSTSASKPTPRFFKTVSVERAGDGGWQVMLDARPLRTPGRNPVVVPTEALALALAAEWEWLPNGKPAMHLMPLMGLAATALDQPKPRPRVVDDLLKYATTDAACVRYEPGALADRQAAAFDPLLAWAAAELGWRLSASDALLPPPPPAETLAAVRRYLEGLDAWRLAAAEQLTAACKSVVLAAAVLRGRVRPEDALAAARLEEEFQIEDWGMVEAGHDLDAADLKTRVLAPAVFVRLLGDGSGGLGGLGSGGSGSGSGGRAVKFATSAGGAP